MPWCRLPSSLPQTGRRCAASVLAVAALALGGGAGEASAASRVTFRTPADVPEEGVSLRVPRGARAKGLPTPEARTFRDGRGRPYEGYAPRDLWMADQFRGQWEDEEGHRVTLGAAVSFLPRGFGGRYVLREPYRRALAAAAAPADAAGLARWATDFTRMEVKGAPREVPGGPRLEEVIGFRFAASGGAKIGYAFRFRPNPFGVDNARWFFALVELPGMDADEAEALLDREFLPNLAATSRRGGASEAAGRFRNDDVAVDTAEVSGEMAASRRQVINSIRGMEDWWYVETPNYLLVSDLPGSRAAVVRQIQADVEYLRAAYAHLVPPLQPITAVSTIRIFSEGKAYEEYVGPAMRWSSGAWMSSRKELVVRAPSGGRVRDQKAWLVETVYHEALHQYLFYALGAATPAAWFNEGHATFFEGADIRQGRLYVEEVRRHAERAEAMAEKGFADLPRLLGLSYADFYRGAGRSDHYALAWALVYYLRKGAPLEKDNTFEELPARYVEALRTLRDPDQATRAALQGVDAAALARAMSTFWRSRTARADARRYDLFKDYRPAGG